MQNLGLKIIAAFDVDPEKIQTKREDINVLHINKFPQLAEMLNVSIGVLTTPGNVAQEIAELMVKGGIKAIWNLTPSFLKLPENIVVQNTSMYSNVAVLLKKLELSNIE
jgi:redox-sensing transcriptional repressor